MIPYYLREIPGNKFNSSEETPVFWHHANPEIGLFAFMYGLGGIIDGESALNITADACRQIEQRTDTKQRKEVFLKELLNDVEERLLIGGGRRDKPLGLKAMLDMFWVEGEKNGHFLKAGTGKAYLLQNDGKLFPLVGNYRLGAGKEAPIRAKDFSGCKGILLAPADLSKRVTEEEIRKIFERNDGGHPFKKLNDLEKKIAEPEMVLLKRYSRRELEGILKQYGKDSFIPEETKMLAGVVAAVAGETPELREKILLDMGVGHISLMYIDLEDEGSKIAAGLQRELAERSRRILNLEGTHVLAQTERMLMNETILAAKREADELTRRVNKHEELLTRIYLALGLEEIENPDEVVLTAIAHAHERERELGIGAGEIRRSMEKTAGQLEGTRKELQDAIRQHALLEERHKRLAGDYASLRRHKDSARERYETMLGAGRQEKERAEKGLREGREYSKVLERKVSEMCGIIEALAAAIGIPNFDARQVEGMEEAAHRRLSEERRRYARLVGVVREETALKEDYQRTVVQLEEALRRSETGKEEIRIDTEREKDGLRTVLAVLAGKEERLREEFSSLQERYGQMQSVNTAFDELVQEADRRGAKITDVLADHDAFRETVEKMREQVNAAAQQILSARREKKQYQKKAEETEGTLRSLTESSIRQGTMIDGLRETVRIFEGALDGLREEASLRGETIASLSAELEGHQMSRGKKATPTIEQVKIDFPEDSLARIRAIVDKYSQAR